MLLRLDVLTTALLVVCWGDTALLWLSLLTEFDKDGYLRNTGLSDVVMFETIGGDSCKM